MIAPLQIDVGLGERRYPIRIGAGLLSGADRFRAATDDAIHGRHALIVSDDNVAPLYSAAAQYQLQCGHPQMKIDVLALPAGEAHKNLDAVARVFNALAQLGATRDASVIALGGGMVGDIAGFAAACWMRGIDFIQVPTTLLAMVDASVGGKTGVDLPQGKNLIGAFHQPRAVIADIATLATLPDRAFVAGFAEVIKTACIGDKDFFAWLEANVDALLSRDVVALTHAIAICCRFKAGVVERDECETGERELLNFGHTFGHAIETEAGYGNLLHGEAVAIGMALAALLSAQLGMASEPENERLRSLLLRFCLPVELPAALQSESLLARMRLDKKNRAGALRLILWRGIGHGEIVTLDDETPLRRVLQPIQ